MRGLAVGGRGVFGVVVRGSRQPGRAAGEGVAQARQTMAGGVNAALARKDIAAAADHYTADVIIQNLCPEAPPVVGREVYAQRLEAAGKAGLRNYSSKVKEAHLLGDGLAWSTGTYVFTITN